MHQSRATGGSRRPFGLWRRRGTCKISSPRAVESLLEEAARAVSDHEPITLPEFLKAVLPNLPNELAAALGRTKAAPGRVPLFGLLREAIAQGEIPSSLGQRIGVDPSIPISLPDITLWLFRDLQADRLLSEK